MKSWIEGKLTSIYNFGKKWMESVIISWKKIFSIRATKSYLSATTKNEESVCVQFRVNRIEEAKSTVFLCHKKATERL